jgi:hypothetical protein
LPLRVMQHQLPPPGPRDEVAAVAQHRLGRVCKGYNQSRMQPMWTMAR